MNIRQIPEEFPHVESPSRSQGVHVTEVIRDLLARLYGDEYGDGNTVWAEVGFVWERLLGLAFGTGLGQRPDEVELDGLVGSPDGVDIVDGELVVQEYKVTWRSSGKPLRESWVMQVKAYCMMVGATRATFRVLYLNGDYKPPSPRYVRYDVEFGQEELVENWVMLVNHAKGMR